MGSNHAGLTELPEGIFSLLDTDLYKLTMQCAILKYLPDVREYPVLWRWMLLLIWSRGHIRLHESDFGHAIEQESISLDRGTGQQYVKMVARLQGLCSSCVAELGNITLSPEELQYLKGTCTYFNNSYLRFLTTFRLQPSQQVKVLFEPLRDTGSADDLGDIHFEIGGLWLHTILYEIPLLALTSEAYFRFCDKDWSHKGQEQKGYAKGVKLMDSGCVFSEFGTRRRRDYHTHDLVMQGLTRAASTASEQGWKGKLSGTSNVHFAMKYGIPPVGTVAHEWFMGIASITNDYEHANETALRYWVGCFGEGVLGIALTDTFGTPTFLKAFKKSLPTVAEAVVDTAPPQLPSAPLPAISATQTVVDTTSSVNEPPPLHVTNPDPPRSYAQTFTGVRQDSGNPLEFVKLMRDFYDSEGITDKKTIVFSDSLNIELCLEYMRAAEEAGFNPTFGIGTFLTSK